MKNEETEKGLNRRKKNTDEVPMFHSVYTYSIVWFLTERKNKRKSCRTFYLLMFTQSNV